MGGEIIFNLAILTISDSGAQGQRSQDVSGDAVSRIMSDGPFREVIREIVPDEREAISSKLCEWSDAGSIELVVTTGGTGLGPRDVTPEATRDVLHLEAPGLGEAMRVQTLKHTPFAILSRGVAGVRNGCLIVNLPGSPSGVEQCLEVVGPALPHALEMVKGHRTHPAP